MVRWFFLACVAAFVYVANMVVLEKALLFYEQIIAFTVLNMFALSLALIWLWAYIPRLKTSRVIVLSLLLMYFCIGATYLYFGVTGLLESSCDALIAFNLLRELIAKISPDYACDWLAAFHILIGAFFLWMVLANIGKLKRESH